MEGTEAFLWSVQKHSTNCASKKEASAYPPCLVGCEVGIADVESPIVVDSSSILLWWNFRANSSMSRGGTSRPMDRFHWLDHALDNALCFTLTSCNDQNFRDTFTVSRF